MQGPPGKHPVAEGRRSQEKHGENLCSGFCGAGQPGQGLTHLDSSAASRVEGLLSLSNTWLRVTEARKDGSKCKGPADPFPLFERNALGMGFGWIAHK